MSYKVKIFIFLTYLILITDGVYIYSSFWAPLFDPRILNYKVDVKFDPGSGKNAREEYERKFGYRGEKLIESIGKGRSPDNDFKSAGDVHFYYTYQK